MRVFDMAYFLTIWCIKSRRGQRLIERISWPKCLTRAICRPLRNVKPIVEKFAIFFLFPFALSRLILLPQQFFPVFVLW